MKLFVALGRLVVLLAMLAFVTAISLFVVGAYLATWPVLRLSPRDQRLRAIMDLGVALFGVLRAYTPDPEVTAPPVPRDTPAPETGA